MRKVDQYRETLRGLEDWEPFLLEQSALPGPRANLELVAAVVEEADATALRRWAARGPDAAPRGSAEEFLPVCGVAGLGRLAAEGDRAALDELRRHANDPRWRVREAVAIALQRLGDDDLDALVSAMRRWAGGTALERRAAVAGLCEPRLLVDEEHVGEVLALLGRVTSELGTLGDERDDVLTLRKALGYAWSVAVAALPGRGKPLFERLLASRDDDVRWIARENLRKKRLERMDAEWLERAKTRFGEGAPGKRS